MKFFEYNRYKIKEKSIKRVFNWIYGNIYELSIQKSSGLVGWKILIYI